MSAEKVKSALLVVGFIGFLTFLYTNTQKYDVAKHHEIVVTIQKLFHQDSLLNESILQFAADRFSNYDPITEHNKKISMYIDWLKSRETGLYGHLGNSFDKALEDTESTFISKMALVEKFKSHNGILKNSLYYLPTAIENNQKDLRLGLYHADLNLLLREILLFNSRPNLRNKAKAIAHIKTIKNSNLRSLLELSMHAETIITQRVKLKQIVDSLFALPTKPSIENIYLLYSNYNEDIIESSSRYRTAMYAMALIIILYVLLLFFKIHRTMNRLDNTLNEVAFQKKALDEHAIVVSIDSDRIIDYVNDKFVEISQFSKDEVVGQPWSILDSNTESEAYYDDMWSALVSGQRWTGEINSRRKEGNHYVVDSNIVPFMDKCGKPIRFVALLTDITERKQSEERIFNLAHYDSLTELANRAFFINSLESTLKNITNSKSDKLLAVLFLDLDNFKTVNDTLGHAAGDKLLVHFANHLRTVVRDQDLVSRHGGDEFVIALTDANSRAEIEAIVSRIVSITDRPIRLGQKDMTVSTSVGISIFPDDGSTSDSLLQNADIALYRAKSDGKNKYRFFTEQLKTISVEKHVIEADLRSAIANNQFELYYQPQIHSESGEVSAVEALLRWNHPQKGLIRPDQFIPILEDSGLIIEVGKWVIAEAISQLISWNKSGYRLRVAVNVSAHQVRDDHLVDFLHKILESRPIQPSNLELELTESSFLQNTNSSLSTLKSLSGLGVNLSLDDFGTGYSSLSYLKKLPINTLKIDKSFISNLPQDQHDMTITTTIIAMAKSLNLTVVAEGVETAEQMEFLKNNHCEYLQGYYIGKPMRAREIHNFLYENQLKGLKYQQTG